MESKPTISHLHHTVENLLGTDITFDYSKAAIVASSAFARHPQAIAREELQMDQHPENDNREKNNDTYHDFSNSI